MKNLNNNNSQVKGGNQMQMNINNFWTMVEEMNIIAKELFDNRHNVENSEEPDAGTLEILANCDAIEEALSTENDDQEIAEILAYVEQVKLADEVRAARFAEMDAELEELLANRNNSQLEDDTQEQLRIELEQELVAIEKKSQPTEYECGINNIKEYLSIDRGSQIEFDDDMDDIDRRNVYEFLDTRLA